MTAAITDIKQTIKERTVELSMEEYVELLRDLAMWAEDEANIIEYQPNLIQRRNETYKTETDNRTYSSPHSNRGGSQGTAFHVACEWV